MRTTNRPAKAESVGFVGYVGAGLPPALAPVSILVSVSPSLKGGKAGFIAGGSGVTGLAAGGSGTTGLATGGSGATGLATGGSGAEPLVERLRLVRRRDADGEVCLLASDLRDRDISS